MRIQTGDDGWSRKGSEGGGGRRSERWDEITEATIMDPVVCEGVTRQFYLQADQSAAAGLSVASWPAASACSGQQMRCA